MKHVSNTSFRAGWKEISFLKKAVKVMSRKGEQDINYYRVHVKKQGVIFLACKKDDLLVPFQNCHSPLKLCHTEDSTEMK